MNWGTVGSMWLRATLGDGHEQAVRYGVVLGWRAKRVVRNTATPLTAGASHPSCNRRTLAARIALELAEKACGLVS